jgi:hypothetical protein
MLFLWRILILIMTYSHSAYDVFLFLVSSWHKKVVRMTYSYSYHGVFLFLSWRILILIMTLKKVVRMTYSYSYHDIEYKDQEPSGMDTKLDTLMNPVNHFKAEVESPQSHAPDYGPSCTKLRTRLVFYSFDRFCFFYFFGSHKKRRKRPPPPKKSVLSWESPPFLSFPGLFFSFVCFFQKLQQQPSKKKCTFVRTFTFSLSFLFCLMLLGFDLFLRKQKK